jgi:hypothetical protein
MPSEHSAPAVLPHVGLESVHFEERARRRFGLFGSDTSRFRETRLQSVLVDFLGLSGHPAAAAVGEPGVALEHFCAHLDDYDVSHWRVLSSRLRLS